MSQHILKLPNTGCRYFQLTQIFQTPFQKKGGSSKNTTCCSLVAKGMSPIKNTILLFTVCFCVFMPTILPFESHTNYVVPLDNEMCQLTLGQDFSIFY